MAVIALSYIGVNSDKFEDWSDYSQKYLGMQQMDRGKEILSFRMDDQKQRLTITGDKGDGLGFLGWEVESKEDLQTFANKLEENKIVVNHGKTSFADKRFVEDLIYFNDPQGNRIELVYKPMLDTDPFKPGRPISGFKTGPLGMGHAVVHVKKIDNAIAIAGSHICSPEVHPSGFEPETLGLEGRCSVQLSYRCILNIILV